MDQLKSVDIHCPYCGERIPLDVDCSVEHQDYIEDCSVCCRPINLSVSVLDDQINVVCRHENE